MSALIANHVTSGMVVVVCWWLAHSEARSVPPGRLIAVCYSIVGLSVLMTAIGRGAGLVGQHTHIGVELWLRRFDTRKAGIDRVDGRDVAGHHLRPRRADRRRRGRPGDR